MNEYSNLWRALEAAGKEPVRPPAALIAEFGENTPFPSPWAIWTLIGLVRHRRRQIWVGKVVTQRLGGDLDALAQAGAFAHPDEIPQSGLVPGLTEWEYYFHGKGCQLTHRGTGEKIDVDFFGPNAEGFDLWFYLNYLRSLRNPDPPEARLIALHPSFDPIRLAVNELLEKHLLEDGSASHAYPFVIAKDVLDQEEKIDAFCQIWEDPNRRLELAIRIGDWPAAHDEAQLTTDESLIKLTAQRKATSNAKRCTQLTETMTEASQGRDLRTEKLQALDDLNAPVLDEELRRILRGPIEGGTSSALKIIQRRDEPAWDPEIYCLFRRLQPSQELSHAYLWGGCLQLMLKHNYRAEELRRSLTRAEGVSIADVALLALEHAPEHALVLFRRALRSGIPINRSTAAATLALIDRPWSHRELIAVLKESTEQAATAECRAALLECYSEAANQAALAWEDANPHEPEPGPWISVQEMMLRNCAGWIRHRMEQQHDRVMKVRDRVPTEAPAPPSEPWRRIAAWLWRFQR